MSREMRPGKLASVALVVFVWVGGHALAEPLALDASALDAVVASGNQSVNNTRSTLTTKMKRGKKNKKAQSIVVQQPTNTPVAIQQPASNPVVIEQPTSNLVAIHNELVEHSLDYARQIVQNPPEPPSSGSGSSSVSASDRYEYRSVRSDKPRLSVRVLFGSASR
ncbi:MAG: hypothetical protein RMK73_14675 [Geminicoccaceae bacterium]|nr:hypothetical protein [Geminicoccaceae bacterium]MCS7267830.1 hypothetical protein [Geminicoccaceae bacterium]MDW8342725.1 hypothetical protein [Geminicoccaceae bacterium]